MRSVGRRYSTEEAGLLRFDRFLQCRPDLADEPIERISAGMDERRSDRGTRLEVQSNRQTSSKGLRRTDPTIKIIPFDGDLERRARQLHRRPYIINEDEVRRLLRSEHATSLPSDRRFGR